MDDLENFVDSIVTARVIIFESEEYADLLSSIVRLRFFHSYSHYCLRENWLAAVAAAFFGMIFLLSSFRTIFSNTPWLPAASKVSY